MILLLKNTIVNNCQFDTVSVWCMSACMCHEWESYCCTMGRICIMKYVTAHMVRPKLLACSSWNVPRCSHSKITSQVVIGPMFEGLESNPGAVAGFCSVSTWLWRQKRKACWPMQRRIIIAKLLVCSQLFGIDQEHWSLQLVDLTSIPFLLFHLSASPIHSRPSSLFLHVLCLYYMEHVHV